MKLGQEHARYIDGLWRDLRHANLMVRRFDRQWNEINDAINAKHEQENKRRAERGEFPMTDLMMAEAKEASLPLKDAYAGGQWWMGKARWLSAAILAEKACMEMLKGGVGWEASSAL